MLEFLTLPEESPVFPQEAFVVQWRVARQGQQALLPARFRLEFLGV